MRLLASALILLAFTLPAGADPTANATPPPKKLTLAQALAALPPPDSGLRLSVSAEQVTLPDDAPPPPAAASPSDVAAAFGDQALSFGSIVAVAPSTMTLLNPQPGPPNIAADINYSTAFKMLAASLDDAQWKMLISERGLGLDDLADDIQRGLFHALFSHGQLWVGSEDPKLADVPDEERTDVQNVSDQIDTVRVRLGQTAHFYLHNTQGGTIFSTPARPDAAQRLTVFHPKHDPPPTEHGVTLSAAVPNALKPSDLDYDSGILQTAVPTAGLKTVGELVTRIGIQTKLELYADPHYAARTLFVQGAAAMEPAGDLLRALCVCVTGTFRKVGSAFVLTDDLAGVGTRRARLSDWEDAAGYQQGILRDQAGSVMLHRHGAEARKLPTFGDPLAVTPEEMAALPDDSEMPGLPRGFDNALPVAKLSSAQQNWVQQAAAEFNEKLRNDPQTEGRTEADPNRPVNFEVYSQVQFVVPSQSLPVDAFKSPLFILFYPGEAEGMANSAPALAAEQAKALAKTPPAPLLSAALRLGHFRAVIGHPRTAADVDALVSAMQKLGLNTLVLDIFSGGVSHLKGDTKNAPDILTEALTRTRGTGIRVYADLSLLSWGSDPPDAVQDLTIDGRSTRSVAVHKQQVNPDLNYDYETGTPIPFVAPPVMVSPVSPTVQNTLTMLVQSSVSRPGLAGLVWEDADADNDLGYTPTMRLSFLRYAHADPLDITAQNYIRADVSLPLFDDAKVDTAVNALWSKAQKQSVVDLLEQLRTAMPPDSSLPVLMEQGWNGYFWYASWDTSQSQPPPLRELSFNEVYAANVAAIKQTARSQGHLVLRRETVQNDGDMVALARKLQGDAKTLPGDGFVLDFAHEGVTQGAAPLESLVEAVAAESRAGGGKAAETKTGETKTMGKAVN